MKIDRNRQVLMGRLLLTAAVLLVLPILAPRPARAETPAPHELATNESKDAGPSTLPEGKNRLIFETSPYLLQHAGNPVNWYPWGEEAFAQAKAQNKPIFLSVGYSTCFWCQVMERESFADPATAELMNRHFVNIKVDREERPDVDAIYMAAVVGMTGSGGWPMSVFLTPELKPFYGGTYFPNDRFKNLLQGLHEAWTDNREVVQAKAVAVAAAIQEKGSLPDQPIPFVPAEDLIEDTVKRYEKYFDSRHGGFGRAPKFPQPSVLEFLMSHYQRTKAPLSLAMVRQTLDAMARGGIYDQVGGGFHRYSTDSRWLVPHFEKMLYDNAQLLHAYVRAYQVTGNEDFRRIAEDIIRYIRREMTSPEGLFYSAQDAAVDEEEGKSYLWTKNELRQVLSKEEYALASRVYGVDGDPNFEGAYILYWPETVAQTAKRQKLETKALLNRIEVIRKKLLATRQKRPQPLLDDKSITSWNGLMIEALATAGEVFEKEEYLHMAETAADTLLEDLRDEQGNLLHVVRNGEAKLPAYLDDYATVISGLMEIYRVTGRERWRNEANRLGEAMLETLWDPAGSFHYAAPTVKHLFARIKETFDGAFPTGNSLAVRALVKLADGGFARYAPYVDKTLQSFTSAMNSHKGSMPYMLWGMYEFQQHQQSEKRPSTKPVIPTTADVLAIDAALSSSTLYPGRKLDLSVTLHMKKGWHVNANPASLKTLVPTTIGADLEGGQLTLSPRYPSGKTLDFPAAQVEIAVYQSEDSIQSTLLPTTLPKGKPGGTLTISVEAQACNDTGRCLVPSTIRKEIAVTLSTGP